MPLARTADLVAAAYRAGSGVVAFNVINLEYAQAIVAGAEKADRPAILQISENAVKFHHGRLAPIAAATTAVAATAAVPLSVHLDHVEDERLLYASAENGFSSVMFDASNSITTRTSRPRRPLRTGPTNVACSSKPSWARSVERTERTRQGFAPTHWRPMPSSPQLESTPSRSRSAVPTPCRSEPRCWTSISSHDCGRRSPSRSCCMAHRASPTKTFARP